MMDLKPYTARTNYWIVAGDEAHPWSALAQAPVPNSDSAYQAWLSDSHMASRINSYAELYDVLVRDAPELAAAVHDAWVTAGHLDVAQEAAHRRAVGIAITCAGDAGLNGVYALDRDAQRTIGGIYAGIKGGDGLPGGGATFVYKDLAGAGHAFSEAQFAALAKAVRDYLYALDLYESGDGALPALPVAI